MVSLLLRSYLALKFVCAFGAVSNSDLRRAAKTVPGPAYKGDDFAHMSSILNGHLKRIKGLSTLPCDNFTAQQLQESVLEQLFDHASPELLGIYFSQNDRRQRHYASIPEIRSEWSHLHLSTRNQPDLNRILRDGLCHQAVMWFVHHLSESKRKEIAKDLVLPLLPYNLHDTSFLKRSGGPIAEVAEDYESKVSCQQCHAGPVWKSWVDATLPLPLPVDPKHPGRERLKSCDYQNVPPCRPCEGLGGPRHGDGVEEFDPVSCSVVAEAEDIPERERPKPVFPNIGHAMISGDTRTPLAVRPDPKKPGKYPKVDSTISLAWDSSMRRQRYDFSNMPPLGKAMSQIYLQTAQDAASRNSSGVMVTIMNTSRYTPSVCICMNAIAGNMDIDSFLPHSPHDPLDLPASEGGLAYLGRIKMTLDGGDNRTVIADHYMKWAFHFLVDAEKGSPSYGLPLRLYGQQGVRFIYSNWTLTDPREKAGNLFEIPKHCLSLSKTCSDMKRIEELTRSDTFTKFV